MNKYYIVYSDTDVVCCNEDVAFLRMTNGWKLYGITDNPNHAETMELELEY